METGEVDSWLGHQGGERYPLMSEFATDVANALKEIQADAEALTDESKQALLRTCPFFETFTDFELKDIDEVGEWVQCFADQIIFSEGEDSRSLYVLLSGEVSICLGGKRITLDPRWRKFW